MKISSFVGIILIVSVAFIGFNFIIEGFEDGLLDTGISDASFFNDSYQTNLNQSAQIEEDFSPIADSLQALGDEDQWWDQLGDFIGAIPIVIISFPAVIFSTLYDGISNITIVLDQMGIPPAIVFIVPIGLIIWVIFKLVNFNKSGKEV